VWLFSISVYTDTSLGAAMAFLSIAASIFHWPLWVGYSCLFLFALFLILAFISWRGTRHKEESSSGEDDFARLTYRELLQTGDVCIRDLEGAAQQLNYTGWSEKHANDLLKFVDRYILNCQIWMANAQNDLSLAMGDVDVALFISNPPTRSKPSYIENEPELGIWQHMAGRLDWLRSELAK
jgi:hypothetical protein